MAHIVKLPAPRVDPSSPFIADLVALLAMARAGKITAYAVTAVSGTERKSVRHDRPKASREPGPPVDQRARSVE